MNNKSSEEIVKDLVAKSKAAQSIFEKYNQNQVDELVTAVAWSICKPSNNKKISNLAVHEQLNWIFFCYLKVCILTMQQQ